MNAELKADIAALAETVKRFTLDRLVPHIEAWERAGMVPRELHREAAALGLLGLGYPEELGGTPAPHALRNALSTTMARHSASGGVMAALFSHNIGLPPILRHGVHALQQEIIPPVLRGERIAALAITEPGCGSDVAALRTTARRDGGDWVIDGEKVFITSGLRADWITMAVRTGQAKGEVIAQLRQDEYEARLKALLGQLDQARAGLRALRAGERPEQRLRLEAQVRAADAKLANARTEFNRYTQLLQRNACKRRSRSAALAGREV